MGKKECTRAQNAIPSLQLEEKFWMSMFCGKAEDEQTKQRQKQQVWIHLIRCASLSWQTQTRCHIASQADVDRHIIFFPLHPFFTLNRVERHENAACQSNFFFMGGLVPRCSPKPQSAGEVTGQPLYAAISIYLTEPD